MGDLRAWRYDLVKDKEDKTKTHASGNGSRSSTLGIYYTMFSSSVPLSEYPKLNSLGKEVSHTARLVL